MAWEQVAMQMAPSILGGLFGGGGGSAVSQKAIEEAKRLGEEAYFKPYTVRTTGGTAGYTPGEGFYTNLAQPYQDILTPALTGAAGMFGQLAGFNPSQRAQEIYSEQAALLEPQFEQQRQQLGQSLFGSGRLGLKLAGESLGLGTDSGMANPEAIAQQKLQQQTLAELSARSREQALGEASQLGQIASGMLQSGMSISEMERQLMATGVDAETARAAAAYASGNLQMQPYEYAAKMAQRRQEGILGAIGSGFGAMQKGGMFSSGSDLSNAFKRGKGLLINTFDPYKVGGTFGD